MSGERPWAYSAFVVEVAAVARLSPGFIRITLRGEALANFAPWGLDQRIKIVLPMSGRPHPGLAEFGLLDEPTPHPSDWYARWKALDEDDRNVLRTYTPSAIRVAQREIDVDFFLHEPIGPASAWALAARPGDPLVITGPDVRMGWTGYGIHWTPGEASRFLLVGDETAFPALRNIVDSLPEETQPHVIAGVADAADDLVTDALADRALVTRVEHRAGDDGLTLAVRSWAETHGATAAADPGFAVWLAGESGVVTGIRRFLTTEVGIPRERISFLGYWRHGGPLVG
ncbi:NADPH-dependent ferric siderophore reductase [Microbacterium arborescens]|uniref:NADPH-dependent ferric siderophore reductase n=1 Tax=Microbacterium arborescens TaxID=33883 RepID=A0ABX2WHX1_9MICO|nr:siderophore-interacting protein [Microbacterium arborescens]OAZ40811.1 NADPH-dependent ferric siderophore reductase [Microbacterium arborescens]